MVYGKRFFIVVKSFAGYGKSNFRHGHPGAKRLFCAIIIIRRFVKCVMEDTRLGLHDSHLAELKIKHSMRIRILLFTISFSLLACNPTRLIVRQMNPLLQNTALALYEESDLTIAEQALASNLKLIDGLLKSDPLNKKLLLLAAEGYAGYALGFAEDKNPQRAKKLYLRARDYALRILRQDKHFIRAEKEGLDALQTLLMSYTKKDVPALFWSGFPWSAYVNLSLNNPTALMDLPKIELLMKRVEELQPDYYYGSVYLFWGAFYGMKPKIMGGDPVKAKSYFEKNFNLNKGRFLLAYVYAARYFAARTLDETTFDTYLKHIAETPVDVLPHIILLNQIAKEKARRLKKQKAELF